MYACIMFTRSVIRICLRPTCLRPTSRRVNNHVNNVRAVELISDALDLYKQPGFVSELQVNYTAETACGESLSLLTGTADSARYIRGEADGRTRFEALATLSPLPDPKEGLV